jgi:hypothetical protein
MDKQRIFRRKLIAAVLGVFGVTGMALAVDEGEPNHPISSAQKLSITGAASVTTGGATVNGIIGNLTGPAVLDVDFYSFYGVEGDVVNIDIDGGIGGVRNVDTMITIFGPGPTYPVLDSNDDAEFPLDAGSTSEYDSRLTNFRLQATGIYTVGVSSYPIYLNDGGTYASTTPDTNGDYTLVVSGVTLPPQMQVINIDVKPGSSARARVKPKSKGVIPVVLLSSSEFNALNVNRSSLTFGATGDEKSLRSCSKDGEDVNGDGRPDLMCHFENELANFVPGDVAGRVKGTAGDGRRFEGRGSLKVVPEKRQR